jgi:hypothetical protein
MDPKIQFKRVLDEIKSVKMIQGESAVNYFDPKNKKRNILLMSNQTICTYSFRPSDIYDFYEKPTNRVFPKRYPTGAPGETRFVDEAWGSFHYNYILKPKRNTYFINTTKMTCSCPFRGNNCKHLHYYKDLYNLSLVFVGKFGLSVGLDLINEYRTECNNRPRCNECNKSVTWYSSGMYLCNKCKTKREYSLSLLAAKRLKIQCLY